MYLTLARHSLKLPSPRTPPQKKIHTKGERGGEREGERESERWGERMEEKRKIKT